MSSRPPRRPPKTPLRPVRAYTARVPYFRTKFTVPAPRRAVAVVGHFHTSFT